MAAVTYIQEAANLERDAIGSLEDEVRTVQHDAYAREAKLKHDAEHEETEAGLDRIRAVSAHNQLALVASFEARRAELERDAKQKMQEIQKQKADVARIVQYKTGLINSLHGTASQLDRLAASAG
jgi:hypothetical protein